MGGNAIRDSGPFTQALAEGVVCSGQAVEGIVGVGDGGRPAVNVVCPRTPEAFLPFVTVATSKTVSR